MPASMAAIKGSVAICRSGSGVDVVECGLELGEGALDGEGDRLVHFLRDLRDELIGLGWAEHTALDQGRAKARHGIAAQGGLVLFALAEHRDRLVLRIVQRHAGRSDDVAVCRKPVDLRFDQRRAGTGTSALDRGADGGIYGQWIGAIDGNARHRVGLGLDGERLAVRGVGVKAKAYSMPGVTVDGTDP